MNAGASSSPASHLAGESDSNYQFKSRNRRPVPKGTISSSSSTPATYAHYANADQVVRLTGSESSSSSSSPSLYIWYAKYLLNGFVPQTKVVPLKSSARELFSSSNLLHNKIHSYRCSREGTVGSTPAIAHHLFISVGPLPRSKGLTRQTASWSFHV